MNKNADTLKRAIGMVPEFADWNEPVYDPVNKLFRIATPGGPVVIVKDVAFNNRSAADIAACLKTTYSPEETGE